MGVGWQVKAAAATPPPPPSHIVLLLSHFDVDVSYPVLHLAASPSFGVFRDALPPPSASPHPHHGSLTQHMTSPLCTSAPLLSGYEANAYIRVTEDHFMIAKAAC